MWDSLDEFFKTSTAQSIDNIFSSNRLKHYFFLGQFSLSHFTEYFFHENNEFLQRNYSPNDPQSVLQFFKRFLLETQERLEGLGENISVEPYISQLESLICEKTAAYGEIHNK
jgi:hypothetical protein